jgi:serine/threonine protein kinase/DNA-binding SARP family transcriptional activator/Tol biopolymer transport system component
MIRLHVLGSLALSRDDGTEIVSVLAQTKRVALLAYLAASPAAYHRRDVLLAMFWPEQDDARGREALNTAISFLRRELGRNAIMSRGLDEIGLNAEMCWSDVGAFRAAFDVLSFAEALALYRGDLLDGFHADNAGPFEDWLERVRAQLRFDAARAARAAAEERERSQHHTTAISCARRALELSDDDERVLRQLLELLDRLGDRTGALVAYEAFERRLAEEFSAEPSAETRALIGRIRARQAIAASESQASNGGSSAKSTPWVIEREIGRGGMATVYLARDTAHDRPVALKMMRPELLSSGAERFLREIRITARLAHPRILPLIDSGVREGAPYLVTPYIEGESLRERLRRVGTVSTREALDLATQIAEALDYAHRSGVIHCDIKPENILLADEQVVVADFGVARAVGADAGMREVVGSHGYMSPEQLDPNGVLDARSDLYSLGCVVTEAICGAVPRDALHADEMLANRGAPERFRRLVGDCLAREKERRPPSAALLLDRLRLIIREMDAERTRPNATRHTQTGRRATRWKTMRRLAAAGGISGIAVLASVLWPSRRAPSASGPSTRRQVTHSGLAIDPALSPDGQTLAFVEGQICGNGNFSCGRSLVVQDLGGGQTSLLARGTLINHPKWNPAGGAVLFQDTRVVGAADTTPGEYLVSWLGGTPQRVGPGTAASFSTRGDTVVLASVPNDTARLRFLRTADLEVLDSATVPSIHGPYTVSDLDWSPDGRWLVLLVYRGQRERRLFLVSRRGGMVTDSTTVPGRQLVRWVRGGDAVLLLLQGGATDDRVFRRGVDRRTGHFTSDTATLVEIPGGGPTFDVSRDGKTLVFASEASTPTELTAIERVGDRVTSRSLKSFTGSSNSPVLSPDGRTIAWSHSDPRGANLYLIPFDSGAERRLTNGQYFDSPVWLRDQRLVLKNGLGGPNQLVVVNPSDAQPRPFGPAQYTSGNPWYLQWLDDSLYALEQMNPHRLLILDSGGSTRDSLAVPDSLGQLLTVTPDRQQIWFLQLKRGRVYSLDRRTKLVKVAFDPPRNSLPLGWADDGYVLVMRPKGTASSPTLSRVNSDGTFRQIAILPTGCGGVSMSRDGTRLVCMKRDAKRSDIWLQRGLDLGR